jgi:hypothetical protein
MTSTDINSQHGSDKGTEMSRDFKDWWNFPADPGTPLKDITVTQMAFRVSEGPIGQSEGWECLVLANNPASAIAAATRTHAFHLGGTISVTWCEIIDARLKAATPNDQEGKEG